MKVRALVDLRSAYEHTNEIGAEAERLGLRYYWIPMSVWDRPSDQATAEFISAVTDPTNAPVYVFCADGRNRTGEMTSIYRIAHDEWKVDEALKEMDAAGFNPWFFSLRNYVWAYARKHRPGAIGQIISTRMSPDKRLQP
jgi:protein tyrosine phosphatase (PTP) superfamily phosphohydrolase (DUF442 family)